MVLWGGVFGFQEAEEFSGGCLLLGGSGLGFWFLTQRRGGFGVSAEFSLGEFWR